METNSSKLRDELLWHMPTCRSLMRSTHTAGDGCCLITFHRVKERASFEMNGRLFCTSFLISYFLCFYNYKLHHLYWTFLKGTIDPNLQAI